MPRREFIFVGTGEGFTSVSCLRMHVIEPTQTWVTHAGNHTSTSGKMGESPPPPPSSFPQWKIFIERHDVWRENTQVGLIVNRCSYKND